MKKIISIFILAVMVFSSVFAYAEASGEISHGVVVGETGVTVSGKAADSVGVPLTIKIVDADGVLFYVNQMLIDSEESFSFLAPDLSSAKGYTYTLRHPRMAETVFGEFYIASEADKEGVFNAFRSLNVSASSANRIDVMTEFLTTEFNAQVLNLDIDAFRALEDSAAVARGMCDAFSSLTTPELVSTKFAELIREQSAAEADMNELKALIASIKAADLEDMLNLMEDNAEALDLKTAYGFAAISDAFAEGDEEWAQTLKDAIQSAATPTQFRVAFAGVAATAAFNEESWGKFEDIEDYYSDSIGSVFDEARKTLTDLELTELKKAMQSEVFEDINDVTSFITTKTAAIVADRKVPSSSSTSGSKRGSSTIVRSDYTPVVPDVTAAGFADCEHVAWAKESILRLKNKGIVNGKSATAFDPDGRTTREEFLKMMLLACGIELNAESENTFTDVAPDSWCSPYISTAVRLGIVTGISDAEFGTGREITRQDMAVLCYRMLEKLNKLPSVEGAYAFSDAESISDYAVSAVNAMQNLGVIQGMDDNRFEPQLLATRAQTAVIIDRLMNLQ